MNDTALDNLAAAQAALADDPTNATRHTDLGMAYFHLDRFDEALAAFQAAIALKPDAADAYNGIGRVYYHIGTPEDAAAAYQRAIDLDPHYVTAYYGLGILYFAKVGDYEAAISTFRLGLERNPEATGLYTGIGTALMRDGRFEESEAVLKQLAALAPTDPHPHINLGILYLHLRRYDEAIAAFECAIERDATDDSAHRQLGFVYERLGRTEDAARKIEQAVALEPSSYESRGALARVYRALGREQEAEEQLATARELAVGEDEGGRACFESVSGNVDAALALLEAALERKQLTPGWARIDPEFVFLQDDPRYQALLKR